MRIVLDTNVLVSGLLNPFGPPGRILDLSLPRRIELAFDDRILAEYEAVLLRPRFGFPAEAVRDLLRFFVLTGHKVAAAPLPRQAGRSAPDPNDLPFAEAALAGEAKALVTGNAQHFAFLADPPFRVLGPREFLGFWEEEG